MTPEQKLQQLQFLVTDLNARLAKTDARVANLVKALQMQGTVNKRLTASLKHAYAVLEKLEGPKKSVAIGDELNIAAKGGGPH